MPLPPLLPNQPDMENSFAYMANVPLKPGTTYTADLTYTLNGRAGHIVWKFTTVLGASPTPQSQTAAAELR